MLGCPSWLCVCVQNNYFVRMYVNVNQCCNWSDSTTGEVFSTHELKR